MTKNVSASARARLLGRERIPAPALKSLNDSDTLKASPELIFCWSTTYHTWSTTGSTAKTRKRNTESLCFGDSVVLRYSESRGAHQHALKRRLRPVCGDQTHATFLRQSG